MVRLIEKAIGPLSPEMQKREKAMQDAHDARIWKDTQYREGYYYGHREGQRLSTIDMVQHALCRIKDEGYPRNNSLRDTRGHHFTPYHIHAIHGRSLKPGTSKLTSTTNLDFIQTGDDDSGLAIFTLGQGWRPYAPVITGIYQFDPNDSRVSPVLKGFEVSMTWTQVQWQDHRRLVQMFMRANGIPAWFITDSYDKSKMLLTVDDYEKWWATKDSWYGRNKSAKYIREAEAIRHKYKYRVRYFRDVNLLAKADDGTYKCSVMWNPDTQTWAPTQ